MTKQKRAIICHSFIAARSQSHICDKTTMVCEWDGGGGVRLMTETCQSLSISQLAHFRTRTAALSRRIMNDETLCAAAVAVASVVVNCGRTTFSGRM